MGDRSDYPETSTGVFDQDAGGYAQCASSRDGIVRAFRIRLGCICWARYGEEKRASAFRIAFSCRSQDWMAFRHPSRARRVLSCLSASSKVSSASILARYAASSASLTFLALSLDCGSITGDGGVLLGSLSNESFIGSSNIVGPTVFDRLVQLIKGGVGLVGGLPHSFLFTQPLHHRPRHGLVHQSLRSLNLRDPFHRKSPKNKQTIAWAL